MDLKSKESIEIMLVLAIIFVALYAISFSIDTPLGDSRLPVSRVFDPFGPPADSVPPSPPPATQQTITITSIEDTYININAVNNSNEDKIRTYTWPDDSIANAIILKWGLSQIPVGATILNAELKLYMYGFETDGGDDLYDVSVHRIINFDPVISQATGYTYDGTNSWTPNNCCFNDIPMAQSDIATAVDTKSINKIFEFKTWNVTQIVNDWFSGNPNYGMLVNSDPSASANSDRYFASSENAYTAWRPQLIVTYLPEIPTPDTTSPTININSPTSDPTYTTTNVTIDLAGIASDNSGVTNVTWSNSATGFNGTATGTTNWSVSNILLFPLDNLITVTAFDAAGNFSTDTINVTQLSGSPDTTPPNVSITNPSNNDVVSGIVNIQVNAVDDIGGSGMQKVEFFIDDVLEFTDLSYPFSFAWNSFSVLNGLHEIKAIAYDNQENFAEDVINVTVDNVIPSGVVESFCPNGSNPRNDVFWCANFESFNDADCQNNLRSCWQNLGFNKDWPGKYIGPEDYTSRYTKQVVQGNAAVGQGMSFSFGKPGSITIGGYAEKTDIGRHPAINLRYYVKFSESFVTYSAHHSSGPYGSGTNGCGIGGTFETSQYKYSMYTNNYCSTTADFPSDTIDPNLNPFVLRNNKWYAIEIQRIVDTACNDSSDPFGCNGVQRIWIDDTLIQEYTNLNFSGFTNGVEWDGLWGPRDYYHARIVPWDIATSYDGFVLSNANPITNPELCPNNRCIGRSIIENPVGTADPFSPYSVSVGIEPFFGRHPASDCTGPGDWGASNGKWYPKWSEPWWEATSLPNPLTTEVFYPNGIVDDCPTDSFSQEKSFKVELTQTDFRGGGYWTSTHNGYGGFNFPQQVIHGQIYFPTGNDYSTNPPLAGFVDYDCKNVGCSDSGRYLGITIDNGKFALVRRTDFGNQPEVFAISNKTMQENSWHEFEIILHTNSDEVSLMIDKQIIIPKTAHGFEQNWKVEKNVFGVIDFQGNPPFNVYYDEIQIGTISFWSCEGWGPTSCPFD